MPPLSLQFLSDLESQDIRRQCGQPILLWANDIQQRAIYLLRCLFQKDQKCQSSGVGPKPEATGSRLCAGEFTGQEKVTQATRLGQVTLGDCEPRKGSWQLKLDSPMIASPAAVSFVSEPCLQCPWSFCKSWSHGSQGAEVPVLFRVSMENPGICIIVWSSTLGQRVNWSSSHVAKNFENQINSPRDTCASTKLTSEELMRGGVGEHSQCQRQRAGIFSSQPPCFLWILFPMF